ncbi:MAG: hypothetical protein V3S10_02060 [Dehalococcoidales bacterium]
MTAEPATILIPEVTVYDAADDRDVVLRDVVIDADYARDERGNVVYLDIDEAHAYLAERGKTLPSLPLLVNAYLELSEMAAGNAAAAQLLGQLNASWDRTGTTLSPDGDIRHHDARLGEVVCRGLDAPLQGNSLDDIYAGNEAFFRALLGLRDIGRLLRVTGEEDKTPFYWYPRGERIAMFGGGDFYHMHQYLPGLLMVFCDDEPHPRRVVRGVHRIRD